jgi:glycosyltransferase involved in cell wall biosynthesis
MLRRKGINVIILTQYIKGLPEYEEINGIPVFRKIRAFKPWGPSYILSTLIFLVKKRKLYDIIQCFGIFYYTISSVIMRYICKKKVINRLECAGKNGDLKRINVLKYRFFIKMTWRRVDKIIAITKEIYSDLIHNGARKENIVFIPNSVNTDYYSPPLSKTWNYPLKILFVGRLSEQKGVDILLQAMEEVIGKGFNSFLTVVGDGPLRGKLEEQANVLKIREYVTFVGNTNDVIRYYHDSHILVVPSNWEGLPLVLLEGMGCGLPIVASDIGGIREVIQDGINGLLFPMGNEKELASKIIYLMQNSEAATEMGRISREKAVSYFSLTRNMQSYFELYESLLVQ